MTAPDGSTAYVSSVERPGSTGGVYSPHGGEVQLKFANFRPGTDPEKQPLLQTVVVNADDSGSDGSDAGHGGAKAPPFSSALAAEAAYCLISAGTILFNKNALSSFGFPAPNVLLTFQFVFAVVLLKGLHLFGVLHLEPLRWDMIRMWLPVNLIFVAMNATGFYALMNVTAGMFTVLKNLANLLTIGGDYFFFGKTYSWQVWACLALMILSAGLGGWSDVSFSAAGYAWQIINCAFTAAYSLYLSKVVRQASTTSHDKRQLSELSMVYYNNVLSVPTLLLLSLVTGELPTLRGYPYFSSVAFYVVAVCGALVGFGVSFASIWCMSRTSATLYSLTGSMNKVIVAVVGLWLFREPATPINLLSILLGLLAGFLFVFAKTGTTQSPWQRRTTANSAAGSGPASQSGLSAPPPAVARGPPGAAAQKEEAQGNGKV